MVHQMTLQRIYSLGERKIDQDGDDAQHDLNGTVAHQPGCLGGVLSLT